MATRTPQPFNWPPLTLADAYAPRPPTRWVVDGIFRAGGLHMLYGPPGCLKSLLAADLCACVAGGLPWLAPRPGEPGRGIAVQQGTAIMLDFDNGKDTTLARLDAVGHGHALPESAPLYAVSMPNPWLDLTDIGNPHAPAPVTHADMLTDYLVGMGATVAILDNLGTISGAADENSGEMVAVMSALRRVAEASGCALVVIHHQRKGNGQTGGRRGDSLRGHSSIEAALDLALQVTRDDDMLSLEASKVRLNEVDPFGALWTFEHKAGTHDLAAARFFRARATATDPNAAIRVAIIDALQAGPLNQTQLIAEVKAQEPKASRDRVLRVIDSLVSRGLVAEQAGLMKNAKLYSSVVPTP